jgi:hypothetical protein
MMFTGLLRLNVQICLSGYRLTKMIISVGDPDPDPHVFGPPRSGYISQRYGSRSFYHQAKILRKY